MEIICHGPSFSPLPEEMHATVPGRAFTKKLKRDCFCRKTTRSSDDELLWSAKTFFTLPRTWKKCLNIETIEIFTILWLWKVWRGVHIINMVPSELDVLAVQFAASSSNNCGGIFHHSLISDFITVWIAKTIFTH